MSYLTDLVKLSKIRQYEKDVRPKRKTIESLLHVYSQISKCHTFFVVTNVKVDEVTTLTR